MKTLKSIRLDNDLIAEISVMAEQEARSFSNMAEHLLTKSAGDYFRSPAKSISIKEARGVVVGSPPAKRFVKTTIKDQKSVIDYLNVKSDSNYQHVMSNIKLISGRLAEGRTVEEIKQVIDRQCMAWPPDHHMRKYLRPKTLFNAEKFNQYFGQLGQPIITEQQNGQSQRPNQPVGEVARIHATIDARAKARLEALQSGWGGLHEGGAGLEEV